VLFIDWRCDMKFDPYYVQYQRWHALQAIAKQRKIHFCEEVEIPSAPTDDFKLNDLITLCELLEQIMHAPPGR
jgi:hypothetical protein